MVEVPELWRTIPSFPEYEASTKGRIRKTSDKIVRKPQSPTQSGTIQVCLDNGYVKGVPRAEQRLKQTHRYIHRLVAETWMIGFDKSRAVLFKDGDKTNTSIWNLEQIQEGWRAPDVI